MRQIIFTQRNEDPIIGPREIEVFDHRIVTIQLRLEGLGSAILDEIGQVFPELRRTLAAKIVALRQCENLLELIEDDQRRERAARGVAQQVATVVEKLPQGLARGGDARLGPRSRVGGGAQHRPFHLLRWRRRFGAVVDSHIHRAEALRAQTRHHPGAQNRRLPEARLAEEDREQLALHATAQLRDLLVATVEKGPRLLGKRREPELGILWVD